MEQTIQGRRRGTEYDAAWWQRVHALYEECFPGLPKRIEAAAALGADWRSVSTPFVAMEGGRALAHAGVIAHPVRLAGETTTVAGIHAVCTTRERRREGWARRVLNEALAWVDERFVLAKLHTDVPAVYEPHEFRVVPVHRFRTGTGASTPVRKRRLRPRSNADDAALLARLLKVRAPVSDVCAGVDPGWMDTIVASLSGVIESGFWLLDDHEAIVAFGKEGGSTLVLDVIAEELPPEALVVGAAPDPRLPVVWTFSPDRFCGHAEALPVPREAGVLMVRGDWPVGKRFGISPLWEH